MPKQSYAFLKNAHFLKKEERLRNCRGFVAIASFQRKTGGVKGRATGGMPVCCGAVGHWNDDFPSFFLG
jgi:hypothetical protein